MKSFLKVKVSTLIVHSQVREEGKEGGREGGGQRREGGRKGSGWRKSDSPGEFFAPCSLITRHGLSPFPLHLPSSLQINSRRTILVNLYEAFLFTALKTYFLFRCACPSFPPSARPR